MEPLRCSSRALGTQASLWPANEVLPLNPSLSSHGLQTLLSAFQQQQAPSLLTLLQACPSRHTHYKSMHVIRCQPGRALALTSITGLKEPQSKG